MTVLAGDVGGTNTRLALYEWEGKELDEKVLEVFPSSDYEGLYGIVKEFRSTYTQPIGYACFGIAGPIIGGRCETPNLPWVVDASELVGLLGLKSVDLINDLEANAYGIAMLDGKDFSILNEGSPEPGGNAALLSAGTGLGEAGLYWDGSYYRPFPSEGGHASFAPRCELEVELLLYLIKKFGHVSYERVLSGPGLYNIYTFLRDSGKGEEPAWLADALKEEDPPAVISHAALDDRSDLCTSALDLFTSLYGAEAGNLALKMKATGGVFLGGGIAPKIITKLKEPVFLEAFGSKGRMRSMLEPIPVKVILNEHAALLGAAQLATLRMSGPG